MEETIDSKRNNCTLVAVREVSRLTDAKIFSAFRDFGYKDNQGMYTDKWIGAAKALGLEIEEVNCRKISTTTTELGHTYNLPCAMTVGEFVKEFVKGVFFVTVHGHAFVVRDGKVIDHNRRRNLGMRRRVYSAHRVKNAPDISEKLSEYIMMPRVAVKRPSSAAGQRWYAAYTYLRANKNVTAEELVKNTIYTEADLKHDLKKGLLVFKPIT